MAISKAEKTAIKLLDELLTFAQSAEMSESKSDFTKGLAAGYRNAAQMIVWRLRDSNFSE
jgi:hypothetical protein